MRYMLLTALLLAASTLSAGECCVIPSKDAIEAAEAKVATVYAQEVKAANSPATNRDLAERLLKTAGDERDAAVRYALLTRARQAAVDGMDAALGYRITEAIANGFGYRPVDNPTPDEWLAKGDEWKAKARKESNKKENLSCRLFAAEAYLRAYPSASGVNRDLVQKRIDALNRSGSETVWVRIVSKNSDMALAIGAGDRSPGAAAIQWDSDKNTREAQWRIVRTGDACKIQNRVSGLWLGVKNCDEGQRVCQLAEGEGFILWKIKSAEDGYVAVTNVESGLCWDIPRASKERGAVLSVYHYAAGANQLWRIEPVR